MNEKAMTIPEQAVEAAYRKQRVHGLPDEDFWAIMRGDAEIALVPIGLEKEADEIVSVLNAALPPLRAREEKPWAFDQACCDAIKDWLREEAPIGARETVHSGHIFWLMTRLKAALSGIAGQATNDAPLRQAMQEACDLLAERKYGSPARSPGHNARLCLEAALKQPASTAGQEWREPEGWQDRVGEALLPFGLLARRYDHHKAPDDEIVRSHGAFGKSGDRGYTHITVGDLRRAAALLNELAALPAPPVTEPIVAEKRDE